MEVSAVGSPLITSSNNNNNNTNNNNNNGNSQLIDENNLQIHQQRAQQFIMSTKGISNCIGNNSYVNSTNDISSDAYVVEASKLMSSKEESIGARHHTHHEQKPEGSSDHEPNEANYTQISELISQLLSKIESQNSDHRIEREPSTGDSINAATNCETKVAISRNEIPPQVSLNLPLTSETPLTQQQKDHDLSPDEATSDLVIDADLPSNNSDDNNLQIDQCEPETLDQAQSATATKTAPTPYFPIETITKPHERECTPQIHDLPTDISQHNDEIAGKQPSVIDKPIDQDVKISIVAEDDPEDPQEEKSKDIVTLKNVVITPPPPPPGDQTPDDNQANKTPEQLEAHKRVQGEKRKRSRVSESTTGTDPNSESGGGGRSKRQRRQTNLFQAGDVSIEAQPAPKDPRSKKRKPEASGSRSRKKSTASTISDANLSHTQEHVTQQPNDVIFYEKDDYLAVRNEENTFYLCQLAENVRVGRPLMKVRWLDTKNGGETYYLTSQYDKVFQKSIIMPVVPNKLKSEHKGEQLFALDDQVKANIMDRLMRSLTAQTENCSTSQ